MQIHPLGFPMTETYPWQQAISLDPEDFEFKRIPGLYKHYQEHLERYLASPIGQKNLKILTE
jgi:hypothetical protein